MTNAPKRIWGVSGIAGFVSANDYDNGDTEYHRADLSADLVRAGYIAGVMDVQKIASDAEVFDVSDEAEYLSADPAAVAAIVAQVMEKD